MKTIRTLYFAAWCVGTMAAFALPVRGAVWVWAVAILGALVLCALAFVWQGKTVQAIENRADNHPKRQPENLSNTFRQPEYDAQSDLPVFRQPENSDRAGACTHAFIVWCFAKIVGQAWMPDGIRHNRVAHECPNNERQPEKVSINRLSSCCSHHAFQAALYVLLLLTSAAYSVWRTDFALKQQWQVEMHPEAVSLNIQVTGLPETDEQGRTQFLARATTQDGRKFDLLLRDFSAREWTLGSAWQVKARVRAPVRLHNVAGFDAEAWALAQGIDGMGSLGNERFRQLEKRFAPSIWVDTWRGKLIARWQIAAAVAPDGTALMRALTIGERAGLSPDAWAAFRPLGINHLISISGLHVTMFALLAAALVRQLLRFLPFSPQRPRTVMLIFGALAAAVYTLLAGAEVPALRSALMLAVYAVCWWRRGWVDAWRTWWLAMTAVLLFQPFAVLTVGFWLSFGLVGALMWALSWRLRPRETSWQTKLYDAIHGQWAATLVGGVATVFLFGLLPVFSPLVNALAIPWFSWLLVPLGMLALVLPFDAPLVWVAQLAQATMDVLLWLGARLPESSFAHAPVALFALALCASLGLLLSRGGRFAPLFGVALLAFALYRPPVFQGSGSLKATVFDVGQGLAVLLQTPDETILFDTGTPAAEWALLPNLRALGVKKLDKVIVSHHDNDHDGGLITLQKSFKIKVLYAGQPEFYATAHDCRQLGAWQSGKVRFEMLTLPRDLASEDNEQSCVLRVLSGGQALLITGDLGSRGERALIAQYGNALASDVLILGHHGSRSSSSSAFINTVAPQTAIASSGFANAFKHPHPEVQTRLRAHKVALWRTDTMGMVWFELGGDEVKLMGLEKRFWWQKKPF
ncbi:DNA internalization-related competence protein ComEC/Rec2 [Neisseriaceae bacterium B1]